MATSARLLIQDIRGVTVVTFQEISILDALQIDEIGEEIYQLVDEQAKTKMVLDFANVRFLSSSALGVLITLSKKMEAIKGQMVLCSLQADLLEVFQISRLDRLFTFRDNEQKALAVFGVTMAE